MSLFIIPLKLCSSIRDYIFAHKFSCGLHTYSAVSPLLSQVCWGESHLVLCFFEFFCIVILNMLVFVHKLFVSFIFPCLKQVLCLCLRVSVCSWQPLWACVSLVVFRSIKQFRHLHGLLLRAQDPKNARLWCRNLGHYWLTSAHTVSCWHATQHFTGRKCTSWHTLIHTCNHVHPKRRAGTNLSFF